MLAVAVVAAAPQVLGGQASAPFTVSATLAAGPNGGSCRLNPGTGLVECRPPGPGGGAPIPFPTPGPGPEPSGGSASPVSSVYWQSWAGYRTFDSYVLLREYNALLGTWSSSRVVNFDGFEYLEMTVSW